MYGKGTLSLSSWVVGKKDSRPLMLVFLLLLSAWSEERHCSETKRSAASDPTTMKTSVFAEAFQMDCNLDQRAWIPSAGPSLFFVWSSTRNAKQNQCDDRSVYSCKAVENSASTTPSPSTRTSSTVKRNDGDDALWWWRWRPWTSG